MSNLNTCDKCGIKDVSEDLIWVDSEDFEPKKGEILRAKACEDYSALCLPCYKSELIDENSPKYREVMAMLRRE